MADVADQGGGGGDRDPPRQPGGPPNECGGSNYVPISDDSSEEEVENVTIEEYLRLQKRVDKNDNANKAWQGAMEKNFRQAQQVADDDRRDVGILRRTVEALVRRANRNDHRVTFLSGTLWLVLFYLMYCRYYGI